MIRVGSWKPYAAMLVVVPVCFAAIYGLTWALGLGAPDPQHTGLFDMMRATGADMASAPTPGVLVALLSVGLTAAAVFIAAVRARTRATRAGER